MHLTIHLVCIASERISLDTLLQRKPHYMAPEECKKNICFPNQVPLVIFRGWGWLMKKF